MRKLMSMAVIAAALSAAPVLKAQEIVTVPRNPANLGIQANWAEEADFGLGIRYENDLRVLMSGVSPRLHFILSFDYFFPEAIDYMEGNINLSYQFGDMRRSVGPYLGGGLNIANASIGDVSETDVGLNILGGVRFRSASRMVPFLEVRYEAGGGEQFVITGGLLFF